MQQYWDGDLQFMSGVGPKRAELLAQELGVLCIRDLLYVFPYRYVDRTKFHLTTEVHGEMAYVQMRGTIYALQTVGEQRKQRLTARLKDSSGEIELVWFQGVKWIKDHLKADTEYIVFGKPSVFNTKVSIVHPEVEEASQWEKQQLPSLCGVYSTTEKMKKAGLHSRAIQRFQRSILDSLKNEVISETLPASVLQRAQLLNLRDSLRAIHFPENEDEANKAQHRFKFEELFYVQLNILRQKGLIEKTIGHTFSSVGYFFNTFFSNHLKFELTGAQKRVIKEIRRDMGTGKQMNRLLQGDVGSGKTLVALMCMLIALDNQYQACLMAPTEILATQHYLSITEMLFGMSIRVGLLTGSSTRKERNALLAELQEGTLHILIGTHALIEDEVQFKNLGLCIIDEQHRFGVAQRARLWKKNTIPPHVLVMTATPIPRTLAMTVYGDLEVSVIDELPPGRKPIKTVHYYDSKRLRLFGFVRDEIAKGRQIYFVYPMIKESEAFDYKDLEDGYESITRYFPPPQYVTVVVHGQMKAEDKERSMQLFVSGKAQIMVATTVIEVGVNVPNASVMVIESAERFGLSQLHQLRGRVGRGAEQSYCILMSGNRLSEDGRKRIATMVQSNDGFEISEVDLQLRGPGDIEGTQQSGIPFEFKIANLAKDSAVLEFARSVATEVLANDSTLSLPDGELMARQLKKLYGAKQVQWRNIS